MVGCLWTGPRERQKKEISFNESRVELLLFMNKDIGENENIKNRA